jgi:hypothetical protein
LLAWLIADSATAFGWGSGGGGECAKALLQTLVEIQTLDRSCFEGDRMYMCSRSSAFQLTRTLTVGLEKGREEVIEGFFRVDGGVALLLDYLEAVLEDEEAEKKERKLALQCLRSLVAAGGTGTRAAGLTIAVGDVLLRSERFLRARECLKIQIFVLERAARSMEAVTLEAHGMGLWLGFLRLCKDGGAEKDIEMYLEGLLICANVGGVAVLRDLMVPHFISTQLSIIGRKRLVEIERLRKEEEKKKRVEEDERRKANRKKKAEEAAKAASFVLGDRVDGKFEINSRDRWFPGVVLGVEAGVYKVLFDDGEFKRMEIVQVRKSKNRKAPPAKTLEAIEVVKGGGCWGEEEVVVVEEVVEVAEEEVANVEGDPVAKEEAAAAEDDDEVMSIASMTDPINGDGDLLDESESGIFLSIPTTLPLKKEPGATLTSNIGGIGGTDKILPLMLSLPNLPTRGGDDGEGEGDRSSLFESFSDSNLRLLVKIALKATAAGGRRLYNDGKTLENLATNVVPAQFFQVEEVDLHGGMGEGEVRLMKMLGRLTLDGQQIDESRIEKLANIGAGNFGFVKVMEVGEKKVALKCIPTKPKSNNQISASTNMQNVFMEITALEACGGVNVMDMVGYGVVGDYYVIASEFCCGGNLLSWR